jgi:DNA-binding XRE family transcriptional regulator
VTQFHSRRALLAHVWAIAIARFMDQPEQEKILLRSILPLYRKATENTSKRVLGNRPIRGQLSPARYVTSRIPNMENDNVELLRLGRRIQTERKLLGLTQDGFAKDCGLNRSHFGGIERGERNLTFLILCRICNQLRCDVARVTQGIPRLSYLSDSKPR